MTTEIRTYRISLNGTQPLLMHSDDIDWADQMALWSKNSGKDSVAGDDRSPAWRWVGYLYQDGKQIILPTENIMKSLLKAGAMVKVGHGVKTFKAQTQSGIMPATVGWPLHVNGKPVAYAPLEKLVKNKNTDFDAHKRTANEAGFSLFLKRAAIGAKKHIRVRPRFDTWAATGDLTVIDEQITTQVLTSILEKAGMYVGLGDWRPGGKTPGTFGMFTATVKQL